MTNAIKNGSQQLSEEERIAQLRLIRSANIGPATFSDLLKHCGNGINALEMLPELASRGGRKNIKICSLRAAEQELEYHKRVGARLIAIGEPDYPKHLLHIDSPPPLISVLGGAALSNEKMVAIVGARNASLSGRKLAAQFARELGQAGFTIASGLARGIDVAAHDAATPSGTIAVFAGGIDILYPPEHRPLLNAILEHGGSAISEMPIGWKPRGRDFPRRNRLISGLSLGVIIIEAAKASGSLHTARYALEQNREILAVPGSPLDPRSEGTNNLIRQGATLTRFPKDVLDALALQIEPRMDLVSKPEAFDLSETNTQFEEPNEALRQKVLSALGPTPTDLDEIIRFAKGDTRSVSVILLELEIAGRIERHRGNKVSALL